MITDALRLHCNEVKCDAAHIKSEDARERQSPNNEKRFEKEERKWSGE